MKAVFETKLSIEEKNEFEKSFFYKNIISKSYRFSKSSLSYYQEYFGNSFVNKSILVFDGELPLLAFIAYSESNRLSHFGSAILVVENNIDSEEKRQFAYKKLIEKVNELIVEESIEEFYFYSNEFFNSDFFTKIKSTEVEFTSIVNLEVPADFIKMNIRKSYKSLVNWGNKNLEIYIMKSDNASWDKFLSFRDFHIKVAQRKTRSDETWLKQYEAILQNEAFLVMAYLKDSLVSCSYIMLGEVAYYGVGVYDRELMAQNLPIAHFNILTSINTAKDFSCKKFDLGFVNYDNENEKDINIFKFKSGFTNQLVSTNKFIANFQK